MNLRTILFAVFFLAATRAVEAGFRSRIVGGSFTLVKQTPDEAIYEDCAKRPFFRIRHSYFLRLNAIDDNAKSVILPLEREYKSKKIANGLRCRYVTAKIEKTDPGKYEVTPLNRYKRPLKYYAALSNELVIAAPASAPLALERPHFSKFTLSNGDGYKFTMCGSYLENLDDSKFKLHLWQASSAVAISTLWGDDFKRGLTVLSPIVKHVPGKVKREICIELQLPEHSPALAMIDAGNCRVNIFYGPFKIWDFTLNVKKGGRSMDKKR